MGSLVKENIIIVYLRLLNKLSNKSNCTPMRGKVFSLFALLILVACFARADEPEKKGPQLTFENSRHDYGTLYVDEMPETKLDIKFTNTGDEPLLLSNVRACCGTRVTQWPREEIQPGEEAIIKIEFRLVPRPQRISRSVTVNYNNPDRPVERYRIVGQIIARE